MINLAKQEYLLLLDPPYTPEALVPSIRDGGGHLCWRYFLIEVLMLSTHIGKFWWKFCFQINHLVGRILIILGDTILAWTKI
jgi:hypothetical protein